MDRFFNSRKHIRSNRVTKIIDTLARNLVDLRVETEYSSDGEWKSDNSRPEFINIRKSILIFIHPRSSAD